MRANSERGIALLLALFLTAALSVLAGSLMFLSQTETYATMNYRMMSQSRYAAEAGVQKAGNFLFDTTQYTKPGLTGADLLANYDYTSSPVKWGGQPVVLSTIPGVASNYPVAAVVTAFQNAAQGTLAAGNITLNYKASAKLISMQTFDPYGGTPGGTAGVVQLWEITSQGTLSGSRPAKVEVVALAEQPVAPANAFAAFATANTCGAMYFHGNVTINSYDSATPFVGGQTSPTTTGSGGNVGTNGNLDIQGSVDVQGQLFTPRTGVGSCDANAVDALSETGHATVEAGMVQLPAAMRYPTPVFNVQPPTNNVTVDATLLSTGATPAAKGAGTCGALGLTFGTIAGGGNCDLRNAAGALASAGAAGPYTSVVVNGNGNAVTMPNVTVASGVKMVFVGHASPAAVVNVNSINGAGDIEVEANMAAANANESVVIRVAGKNPAGVTSTLPDPTDMLVPFDLEAMGWKQNATVNSAAKFDASALQIVYPGTGTINMDGGNSQSAATIYAPNANFILKGTQDLFGSVLAKTVTNGGNASIHYDRRLNRDFYVEGMYMLGTFNWKRSS